MAVTVPATVTVLPTVTVPEMGRELFGPLPCTQKGLFGSPNKLKESSTICEIIGLGNVPTFAVTVPATVCVAGKLETETTLPLTALVMFAMAFEPSDTTVWATICSPPVTTEESVVAD